MPEDSLPSDAELDAAIQSEVDRIDEVDSVLQTRKIASGIMMRSIMAAARIAASQVPIVDSDTAESASAKMLELIRDKLKE